MKKKNIYIGPLQGIFPTPKLIMISFVIIPFGSLHSFLTKNRRQNFLLNNFVILYSALSIKKTPETK